ncbi:MAG: 4-alpha-glucanotransferase [Opitutaceae bacterium]|nr:4-alpha-glucanotransferase [Opitutaceae bacterium]
MPLPHTKRQSSTSAPIFDWLDHRAAGVLLHPTALPGPQGIGVLDGNLLKFLDLLHDAGFQYWQLCPLGPTGFGDSPYQCFSAFAGNPYLVDLEALIPWGLLDAGDLAPLRSLPAERVDFGEIYRRKWPLLAQAHARFKKQRPSLPYGDFDTFRREHAHWLEAYAYFRALKEHHQNAPWWEWPHDLRHYRTALQSRLRGRLADTAEMHAFTQFLFFGQWQGAREAARTRGLSIIGDIPIFVAADSADAWAQPELFELNGKTGRPLAVAGVPPDYFSADGQLWGNPLYRWDVHRADGFAWWQARLRAAFALYDVLRIDHFRGFDTYWRIPWPAATARIGAWTPGPGLEFFRTMRAAFPAARIIAEDLGELMESVVRLRDDTGLPGMTVLQFAFGGGSANTYLPHNHVPNSVTYSGTHDNDTTLGWFASTDERTRDHVRRYFRVSGDEIPWDLIRAAYQSVSRLAVVTLPDILSLGSVARFNSPGKSEGNWQWRCHMRQLDQLRAGGTVSYLASLAQLYGRH